MGRYVLGVDQSTSGTTALIVDRGVRVLARGQAPVPRYRPRPGWVEQDPAEIWAATQRAMRLALQDARIPPDEIEAIGLSNQRETTVVWDRETGEPVGRAIGWQDRRTQALCDRLSAECGPEVEARTGQIILPNSAATKLHWLIENDRGVQRLLAAGRLLYGTVDSWLLWNLTGGRTHATDCSNASVTLLLNAHTLAWDEPLLEWLGIPRAVLPQVRASADPFGTTDPDRFFGERVPVAGMVGDQQAALLGQGGIRTGMAKNSYGSGAFLLMNLGQEFTPPSPGLFSPVLWAVDGAVSYGLEAMADVAGAALRWLQEGLGLVRDSAEAAMLAERVEDTGGVYFVPSFVGTGAPHYDTLARGSMFGITERTTRGHIARAALEGMAYQTRDAVDLMRAGTTVPMDVLRADGGAARSDFLLQFQADILGVPVERPQVMETAALGAAVLAGVQVGFWDSLEETAGHWTLGRRFEPRWPDSRRDAAYAGWLEAVERSAGWGATRPDRSAS
ncbi:glycerol kinase GlpK [Streptomyces sp. DSM 44917]|uniref:Glycerol kinase GlpK n=1 Tax=Streptomyces boetiae TaxID=3075541 RepID=A0ABU2LEM8_9ACTN|nr:glycerol kinase GlpK [Streptomyces sp. DSM 44917]MDT0309972.1 glycerol kinase GlpK [Streptomyces sp. DSM 44917]